MHRILQLLLLTSFFLVANNITHKERKEMVKKIQEYPYLFAYVEKKYKDDEALVRLAIKQNGRILEYASKRLQDHTELVDEAVRSNGGALAYASKRLKDDEDIVSIAIDSYGTYLQYASKRLQDDDEIVMDALRSNGANLQYASKRLQNDKWYVNLAIKNNSSALEYASKVLRNDRDLVLNSVRTYSSNLSYASTALQDDKGIVLEAVKQDGRALRYASKRLKNDKEVVTLALKSNVANLVYASSSLQKVLGLKKEKVQIDFNKEIEDLSSVPLGIQSSLALKSVTIMHDKKILGKYVVTKGEPVDYHLSLNLNHGVGEHNGTVEILLETLKGKKQVIKKHYAKAKGVKRLSEKYSCRDEALSSFTEQKYKRHILKLRIKDEVAYGAFMVMHPMLSQEEAKPLALKADYIEHVVGKIGQKVVFDFHSSARLRSDPFFRFTFNAPKKSGILEMIVTDNRGKKRSFYKAYEI